MKLTPKQLELVQLYQSQINNCKLELHHAQSKLDAFITGTLVAKGNEASVKYEIKDDELIVISPEPPLLPEE